MLENLTQQPPDKIIMLSGMFRADTREEKIDLGVGVYKDANGNTPIMRAVKKAEQMLWDAETTKSYTALIGDGAFHKVMADLVLGDSVASDRLSFAHAPGGTGAIRQILELIKVASPEATIWMSDPTWPNHPAMVKGVGIPMQTYRYLNPETRTVDFAGMMEDLAKVKSGDVVILHGCCHNPTGANLNCQKHLELSALCTMAFVRFCFPWVTVLGAVGEQERHPWFGWSKRFTQPVL